MVHGPDGEIDNDGDGYSDCAGDCNDFDDTVNPDALDICDGEDSDCNGIVDDVQDFDGDGWCFPGDCDDADPLRYPGQWETPFDTIDRDCDYGDFIGLGWSHVTIEGEFDYDEVGVGLAGEGNIDGDAWPDILVGGRSYPVWADGTDEVCAFAGVALQPGGALMMADALACFPLGGDSGPGVTFLDDVEGDGMDEIAIAVKESSRTAVFFSSTYGGGGTFVLSEADVQIELAPFETVASGDIDGDGLGDLLVGAPSWGHAWLFAGTSLAAGGAIELIDADVTFSGVGGSGYASTSMAIGDFDGDAYDDLAIGCPSDGSVPGSAHVFYGYPLVWGSTVTMADAHVSLWGDVVGERTGDSLAAVGDWNGDGADELAVGAPGRDGWTGALYVVDSATLQALGDHDLSAAWIRIEASQAYGQFAWSLAGPGDVDGDGTDDLLVGYRLGELAPVGEPGGADLFSGATLAATGGLFAHEDAAWVFGAEGYYDRGGAAVSAVGDLDGDGDPELMISAPEWGPGAEGRAYLVLNPL
jgi:hypothetical protein